MQNTKMCQPPCSYEAFLDIETTGLSPATSKITLVGILRDGAYIVLVNGENLDTQNLLEALHEVDTVYTFNGKRFDIPFIRERMGIDVVEALGLKHVDVMYGCHRFGLKGGQKAVEKSFGLCRDTEGMDGRKAAILGKRWLMCRDNETLDLLVRYNEEDVRNLSRIKNILDNLEEMENSDK